MDVCVRARTLVVDTPIPSAATDTNRSLHSDAANRHFERAVARNRSYNSFNRLDSRCRRIFRYDTCVYEIFFFMSFGKHSRIPVCELLRNNDDVLLFTRKMVKLSYDDICPCFVSIRQYNNHYLLLRIER